MGKPAFKNSVTVWCFATIQKQGVYVCVILNSYGNIDRSMKVHLRKNKILPVCITEQTL